MGRCGGYAKTVSTVVPGVEGRDPASFVGTPGVDERLQPNDAEQGGDGHKAAYPFLAAAALGQLYRYIAQQVAAARGGRCTFQSACKKRSDLDLIIIFFYFQITNRKSRPGHRSTVPLYM